MFVWKNILTGEIQNDRQSANPKASKKQEEFAQKLEQYDDMSKLENLQERLNELELKRADFELQATQAARNSSEWIAYLQQASSCQAQIGRINQYQLLKKAELKFRREEKEWFDRRKASLVRQFGGVPEDYEPIHIPREDIPGALQSRYIWEEDGEIHYDVRPYVIIDKQQLIVTSGWVRGNERLKEDDITSFKDFGNTQPQDLKAVVYRKNNTQAIEVKIFTKPQIGSWGPEPTGYTKIVDIFQGVLDEKQEIYGVQEWQRL